MNLEVVLRDRPARRAPTDLKDRLLSLRSHSSTATAGFCAQPASSNYVTPTAASLHHTEPFTCRCSSIWDPTGAGLEPTCCCSTRVKTPVEGADWARVRVRRRASPQRCYGSTGRSSSSALHAALLQPRCHAKLGSLCCEALCLANPPSSAFCPLLGIPRLHRQSG